MEEQVDVRFTIIVNGKEFNLSVAETRELKNKLDMILNNPLVYPVPLYPYTIPVPYTVPEPWCTIS